MGEIEEIRKIIGEYYSGEVIPPRQMASVQAFALSWRPLPNSRASRRRYAREARVALMEYSRNPDDTAALIRCLRALAIVVAEQSSTKSMLNWTLTRY